MREYYKRSYPCKGNSLGIILTLSLNDYINAFSQKENLSAITGIGRGIEREALRILPEGKLSEHRHYKELGSALTHGQITTDYAENLLEFITPVSESPEQAIAQLQDIQKFTLEHIDGELLWPTSMPCFVDDATQVPLAQYGSSNIGTMKTVYRQGLKNRYGSMMQVIAGIHFNFSFSQQFWRVLKQLDNNTLSDQDYISAKYFSVIRNYKRYCWLIPYLFGSSPAICGSFLQGKPSSLPFKKSATGSLYLDYATSLRMSDLGYTSSEQISLEICYNNISDYVSSVQKAIALKSNAFSDIGVKVDGKYQQLNDNVLQIENELYAPIRPKRVAKSGEKPSVALGERGVEYIEVRALDVNPFVDTGISVEQIYFLDVFLIYCALVDSQQVDSQTQKVYEKNMDDVVLKGRDPALLLTDIDESGVAKSKSILTWGQSLFSSLKEVAQLLDNAYQSTQYSEAVAREFEKIQDPSKTPSAQLLDILVTKEQCLADYSLTQASEYRQQLLSRDYQFYDKQYFIDNARQSLQDQADIEANDTVNFDTFLSQYFSE